MGPVCKNCRESMDLKSCRAPYGKCVFAVCKRCGHNGHRSNIPRWAKCVECDCSEHVDHE